MKAKSWKVLDKKKSGSFHIFDVNLVNKEQSDGKKATFVEIDAPEWATIIPYFIEDNKEYFLMEKQYRHGENKMTYEFPAGTVERGEDPLFAAKREFAEETGYIDGQFKLLARLCPNSAFMNNYLNIYLVEGFKEKQEVKWDEFESIELFKVPVEDVINDMGSGFYSNGIMSIASFYFLKEKARINLSYQS